MTRRIEFHFNAPALVPYACRLLRKVQGRGLRAQVVGHATTLAQLDQALWLGGRATGELADSPRNPVLWHRPDHD